MSESELQTQTDVPVFGPARGFGLYVHWPYCTRICPYCDFNVYTARDRDSGALVSAIKADMTGHQRWLGHAENMDSIFLGGGTPSLLTTAEMGALIAHAQSLFGLAEGAEITLEANPNDVIGGDIAGWRSAGVTRLSLGVQSLRDDALRFLGRDHDARAALAAMDRARDAFASLSIDLIYARPGQGEAEWAAELTQALQFGVDHLSLYELTISERTAFGKAAGRGLLVPMTDDGQADLYELTQTLTAGAGYPAYEISNHAASPLHRARHNEIYWNCGDWIGVGPGAHGRLTRNGERHASEAAKRPQAYIDAVARAGLGWAETSVLTTADAVSELVIMGLRVAEGLEKARLEAVAARGAHARELNDTPELNASGLSEMIAAGLVQDNGLRIALTRQGRLLADAVARQLLGISG